MKTQEIIDGLQNILSYCRYHENAPALREAIEMLKCSEIPNSSDERTDKRTETHSCDIISRQAAIDAIEEMQMPIMRSEFPEEQFVFTGMSEALNAIKRLPSAQPYTDAEIQTMQDLEQAQIEKAFELGREEGRKEAQPEPRWIPCSERLPEDGTECLVSVTCLNEIVVIDMAKYSTDLFKVDKWNFYDSRGESGWYYLSSEYGYCKLTNVLAWMPLPEPYREEGEK